MSEILAPAGGMDSALAAIGAGADAVYLGLSQFSARSSAENFNAQQFEEICKLAHTLNVKVYVAVNTVVKQNELESFFDNVKQAWQGGADAIIIQDIFLGKYIKSCAPQIKLHLSTQAGCCNVYGAQLAKEYGFDRVILARETKIEDIRQIAKIIETEVFVQGALCTCFSGQCYMSSFAGGNSGNRGKCKQPCRKVYSIDRNGFEERAYRLSLADLSVGEKISELIDAGVYSFKIEGRMRRPEYVSAAVRYFRNIIDGREEKSDLSNLKRTFNRGNYTQGLSFGQDKGFISSEVQGHIGEYVGVIKKENSKCVVLCKNTFKTGDGFKVLRSGKEVGGGIFGGECKGGFILSTRDRLSNGDKVFVTTDSALNVRLINVKKLLPVKISARFIAGERAEVDINGNKYFSDEILESANTRPLTSGDIKNNFLKVDGLPFEITFENVSCGNIFMPASKLNSFRRKAYEEFYKSVSKCYNKEVEIPLPQEEQTPQKGKLTAVITQNPTGVNADIIIVKLSDYSAPPKNINKGTQEKYLYLPPYLTGQEIQNIETYINNFDGIYCDGYYGVTLCQKWGKPLFAGTGFNVTNTITLNQIGAKYVAISKELTLAEAAPLMRENTFYLTAGDIKVMDLIYCPFEKKCSTCDRRERYNLTDENNRVFPIRRYKTSECRFEVFNCANLICDKHNFAKLYDCTLSDGERLIAALNSGEDLKGIYKNYTHGHSNFRTL